MKAHERGFRQGFALALGILHQGFGESDFARMVMDEAGFSLSDLEKAECSDYDLEGIRLELARIKRKKEARR